MKKFEVDKKAMRKALLEGLEYFLNFKKRNVRRYWMRISVCTLVLVVLFKGEWRVVIVGILIGIMLSMAEKVLERY